MGQPSFHLEWMFVEAPRAAEVAVRFQLIESPMASKLLRRVAVQFRPRGRLATWQGIAGDRRRFG